MDLIFANPAGAWALLGVPAVLAIHFFQRRTKRIEITTLFLLEDLTRESVRGNIFERIRNSPLLWMQLLAVLLLAWLMVQPMWMRSESVQQTVIVLDSSVSMRPFRDRMLADLRREVNKLAGAAARSEWTVLESDTTRGRVYGGGDAGELLAAVTAWQPRSAHHDLMPALQLARDLLRQHGVIVLVSDHRPEGLPPGVELLAVGESVENAGFAGARIETVSNRVAWSALLINHGQKPQQRRYHLEAGTVKTAEVEVSLEPGGIRAIRGEVPRGEASCTLVLDPDRFPLDDVMPLVVPQPKALTAVWSAPPSLQPLVERLAGSLDAVSRDLTGRPDFTLTALRAGASGLPTERSGVFFLFAEDSSEGLRPGLVVADKHPLMNGLSWQGLLARGGPSLSVTNADRVLLWQGSSPLIFLREYGRTHQLVFNFDIAHANVERLPALVLLVRRFVEMLRTEKVALERRNVELHQPLEVAARLSDDPVEIVLEGAKPGSGERLTVLPPGVVSLRAPDEPGRFAVRQAGKSLLEGAAHFADAREADFKGAASENTVSQRARELTLRNARRDLLTPLWLVLLAGTLLGSWALVDGRRRRT